MVYGGIATIDPLLLHCYFFMKVRTLPDEIREAAQIVGDRANNNDFVLSFGA